MTIEITFPIRQEVLDKLARLGYTTDDVFEIGQQIFRKKKLTKAQVAMLMRTVPDAVFDEGLTVVLLAELPNDMPVDKLQAHCDTVLDMIAKANETISRALALRQVLDWQARRSEPAEREP